MGQNIRIKLADPGITPSDEEAVRWVLSSGYLVNGSWCSAFENELEKVTRRKHAITVSSGTAALLAAMKALGIGDGSTVIVPALTFPAPASTAAFLGAEVILCDVDPETFCLSVEVLETLLDAHDNISLVVAVDQFGMPAPSDEIEWLLKPRGIPLLVDAACSLGSTLNARPCGSFGSAAILSFHPRKVVTTGEGGAVLTDYDQVASSVRRTANHGIENGDFASIGINLRLSEIGAAIGLTQTERLQAIVERRRALARRYFDALPLTFQKQPFKAVSNYQTLVAVLPDPMDSKHRDDLIRTMRQSGVEIGIASYCIGAIPAFQQRLGANPVDTPVALDLHNRGIALPLHMALTDKNVDEVAMLMQDWLNKNGMD